MESKISEIIARGILFKEGKIVLCKSKNREHYFLPGGHIGFGEKAEDALIREFLEETGENIEIVKFIGAFENAYNEAKLHHEVNLVFYIELYSNNIASKEDHIEYKYLNKDEFREANFLPKFLKSTILKFWDDKQIFWCSGI